MDLQILSFKSNRRFGVEMEVNSFDKRDFQSNPLKTGESPEGIVPIANMISNLIGQKTFVKGWHATHNNENWVLKPDRSCGIEICSPVCKGWDGLKEICKVAEIIETEPTIPVDSRCSLHVHIDLSDCSNEEIAKILYWWIKCESVFLDSVPFHRKRNRYCQCIGMTDLFDHDTIFDSSSVIKKLGSQKYYTANCYHFFRNERKTIEFRIVESDGCKDAFLVKNWIRLLLHFVETAKKAPEPLPYSSNNPSSGFCWLDLQDVMKFLGFAGDYQLSKGMEQIRNWFLGRIYQNVSKDDVLPGVWSAIARKISRRQLTEILEQCDLKAEELIKPIDRQDALYSDEYKE